MKHHQWTTEDWKKGLCTDESKFKIFCSIFCSSRSCRRVGERMVPQCVTLTVKYGGGSMMVWGCFSGSRVGYHSILQRHAVPSGMHIVGQGFILQQDNAVEYQVVKLENIFSIKNWKNWGVLILLTSSVYV